MKNFKSNFWSSMQLAWVLNLNRATKDFSRKTWLISLTVFILVCGVVFLLEIYNAIWNNQREAPKKAESVKVPILPKDSIYFTEPKKSLRKDSGSNRNKDFEWK